MTGSVTDFHGDVARPQQSGPERVRAAVVDAATKLFAERGIHAVSVREIAREVGVSHTLLHLYFGSKEEIVREVLTSRNGRYAAAIDGSSDIAVGVKAAFTQLAADRDWLRAVAAGLIEGIIPHRVQTNPMAQAAFLKKFEGAEPSDDRVDPRLMGAAITSMIVGWAVTQDWLREGAGLGDLTDEEFVDGMGSLLERMVHDYS